MTEHTYFPPVNELIMIPFQLLIETTDFHVIKSIVISMLARRRNLVNTITPRAFMQVQNNLYFIVIRAFIKCDSKENSECAALNLIHYDKHL